MGILAPLFLVGLAGLSLPLIFHLVRRMPRGKQPFSSLMFLSPTPPRLTRRSRLDQVFLLLLRLAALALLAFAFARPFLRESSLLSLTDLPRERVVLLVDTSASMQREDLWKQALAKANAQLDDLAPQDDVALYSFSDRLEKIVGFQATSEAGNVPPADIVRKELAKLEPTFASSDLGTALVTLAGELDSTSDVEQSPAEPQLVVISDFQHGSRIEALQGFAWPSRVRVVAQPVTPKHSTNATLQLLVPSDEEAESELRVRVVNASNSPGDQFYVRWSDAKQSANSTDNEAAIYVPPGQSRVLRLPRPMNLPLADRVVLRGDDHAFDNTFYVAPPRQQEITTLFLGEDKADDAQGALYYWELASSGDPLRKITVQAQASDDTAALTAPVPPAVVVVSRAVPAAMATALKTYAEQGGTVIIAPPDRAAAATIPLLIDDSELGPERPPPGESDFFLLGEIDFTHPLLVPFANPRYNDFTKIHFWNWQPIVLKDGAKTRVLARFDNRQPWLMESIVGNGRVLALTSSWRPDDSQLAVSSKFVPLVGSLLDLACGTTKPLSGVTIHEPAALPAQRQAAWHVQTPAGGKETLETAATEFTATTTPGIYTAGDGLNELRFAVNLPASESDTAPLEVQQLEQLGVRLGTELSRAEQLDRLRQERDTELESRQQVWRWLLVGCVGILILETWWAGRAARQPYTSTEAVA